MRYKKGKTRNEKALTWEDALSTSIYLSKVIEVLKIGGHIIYIDESKFCNQYSLFKTWTSLNGQELIPCSSKFKKVNLTLACDGRKVIHSELLEDNINSQKMIGL
jgi:hypothetical protein